MHRLVRLCSMALCGGLVLTGTPALGQDTPIYLNCTSSEGTTVLGAIANNLWRWDGTSGEWVRYYIDLPEHGIRTSFSASPQRFAAATGNEDGSHFQRVQIDRVTGAFVEYYPRSLNREPTHGTCQPTTEPRPTATRF